MASGLEIALVREEERGRRGGVESNERWRRHVTYIGLVVGSSSNACPHGTRKKKLFSSTAGCMQCKLAVVIGLTLSHGPIPLRSRICTRGKRASRQEDPANGLGRLEFTFINVSSY